MQEEDALEFYERVTQGKEKYEEVSLEHKSGATLTGFKLHAIDKQSLASTIEKLPDSLFNAVEEAEDADMAEDEFEEQGGDLSAVTEDTVNAFEELITKSASHDELTNSQIKHIVEELDFEVLFELGTKIINMSVEDTGEIRAFHEQG